MNVWERLRFLEFNRLLKLTIYTVDLLKLEYAVYAVKAIKLVAHIVQLA